MRVTFGRQRTIADWRVATARPRQDVALGHAAEPFVRQASASDIPAILELIAASYHRENSPLRLDYWRWKHEDNPFGRSPCLVAESNGRLVGVRVFLRWNWHSEYGSVRTARAVDTATLPEWHGRGVFSRLTMRLVEQMQQEGVSFIYNTPNGKSMPGYLKLGWAPATKIPLWIRPIRLAAFVRRSIAQRPSEPPALEGFDSVAEVLNDPRLPAFLADATPNDTRYHTARTAPYLRWRYGMIPGMFYRARFEIAGDAGALVVARCRTRGTLREVTVSELLVTPSIRGVQLARTFLSHLVNSTDADYVAACAARRTAERQALVRAGFLPVPRLGPQFTTRRLSSVGLDPSRWVNWRCSIGDLELF